jgi:hypothetical protein
MCIVLDTNVWGCVFRTDSRFHADYEPVFKWITVGSGFIVYGGSKYQDDLRKAPSYQRVFLELKKKGRAKLIDPTMIDLHTEVVERLVNTPRCDDAHLIAIFRVSGCRLLCSNDLRSDRFIKTKAYYLAGQKPPSIYRLPRHRHLLCGQNVVRVKNEI